mmetsp:Transcript_40414/g.66771  ORF Transcript_40414/g.66771 Transcript_40414/m.66771 type:complete len:201 (-) Transcript_40414:94-696(-)
MYWAFLQRLKTEASGGPAWVLGVPLRLLCLSPCWMAWDFFPSLPPRGHFEAVATGHGVSMGLLFLVLSLFASLLQILPLRIQALRLCPCHVLTLLPPCPAPRDRFFPPRDQHFAPVLRPIDSDHWLVDPFGHHPSGFHRQTMDPYHGTKGLAPGPMGPPPPPPPLVDLWCWVPNPLKVQIPVPVVSVPCLGWDLRQLRKT